MRKRDSFPPIVFQSVGLGAFIFFVAFWAITDRVEPTLLAAAGTLYGIGLASEARKNLKGSDPENPPPVAPAEETE